MYHKASPHAGPQMELAQHQGSSCSSVLGGLYGPVSSRQLRIGEVGRGFLEQRRLGTTQAGDVPGKGGKQNQKISASPEPDPPWRAFYPYMEALFLYQHQFQLTWEKETNIPFPQGGVVYSLLAHRIMQQLLRRRRQHRIRLPRHNPNYALGCTSWPRSIATVPRGPREGMNSCWSCLASKKLGKHGKGGKEARVSCSRIWEGR